MKNFKEENIIFKNGKQQIKGADHRYTDAKLNAKVLEIILEAIK